MLTWMGSKQGALAGKRVIEVIGLDFLPKKREAKGKKIENRLTPDNNLALFER